MSMSVHSMSIGEAVGQRRCTSWGTMAMWIVESLWLNTLTALVTCMQCSSLAPHPLNETGDPAITNSHCLQRSLGLSLTSTLKLPRFQVLHKMSTSCFAGLKYGLHCDRAGNADVCPWLSFAWKCWMVLPLIEFMQSFHSSRFDINLLFGCFISMLTDEMGLTSVCLSGRQNNIAPAGSNCTNSRFRLIHALGLWHRTLSA